MNTTNTRQTPLAAEEHPALTVDTTEDANRE
jgi:hypothetical protein